MAIKVRIETPIAFGLTLTVCLVLFFYCWRIRKIRYRLTGSVQVSALPTADSTTVPPAVEQTGIKKEVIATFPTVKAHELKSDIKEGCPICLVEYADAEVLRKLPRCGHVFHIRCVDSWLENQSTCPVCRILLTSTRTSSKAALRPAAATVGLPAWVLVNRPMPLPPAIAADPCPALQSSSEPQQHMDLGMSPLLAPCRSAAGWGAVYLETHAHGLSFASTPPQPQPQPQQAIQVQSKECIHHASISEWWMTESFVFGVSTSGSDADHSPSPKPCRGDRKRFSPWQQLDDVLESRVAPFRPLALTMSPERCSFEFLPIVTTSESTSFRSHSPRVPWLAAPSRHSFYSQL